MKLLKSRYKPHIRDSLSEGEADATSRKLSVMEVRKFVQFRNVDGTDFKIHNNISTSLSLKKKKYEKKFVSHCNGLVY